MRDQHYERLITAKRADLERELEQIEQIRLVREAERAGRVR
jgi:hypothetical protein